MAEEVVKPAVPEVETAPNTEVLKRDVDSVAGIVSIDSQAQESSKSFKRRKQIKLRCPLCEVKYPYTVPYSDISTLKKFMSVRGNIIARSKSGMCAKHQRAIRRAIGRARYLALIPYVDLGST